MSQIARIDANAKSVSDLLKDKKYQIDYYQREYRWETEHVQELITDLSERFLAEYDEGDSRERGAEYAHYFLGPIILNNKNGEVYVVDGQQRLTSLTLLLIYLHHLQNEADGSQRVKLDDYVFSEVRGTKSFNLQVPGREAVMDALYKGSGLDANGQSESVQNILGRYADIEQLFPEELTGRSLPFFIDWLLYNVDLVEIVAFSEEEAYTIFETMNDRGLRLSMAAMLKGYLLSHITGEADKARANDVWKERVLALVELGRNLSVKEQDIEACKVWLRAKHAKTIRERKKDATDQDFEVMGSAFHRWVRDHALELGLDESKSPSYLDFIQRDFERYTRYYLEMRRAAETFDAKNTSIYYNAHNNLTLQYVLALAPIRLDDDERTAWAKIRLVADFTDIYVARRMVNFRTLSYSSILYTMFNLMQSIRDLSARDLAVKLRREIDEMPESFDAVDSYYLHGGNRSQIHYLLARMTKFIDEGNGMQSDFPKYVNRSTQKGLKRYEVEHIWADRYDRHTREFTSQEEFRRARNRFGGLLLLPRGFNQSFGDLPYEEKVGKYYGQSENTLAKSLSAEWYERNPCFVRFVEEQSLPFQPMEHFTLEALDARQELYGQLCRIIWSPERLAVEEE